MCSAPDELPSEIGEFLTAMRRRRHRTFLRSRAYRRSDPEQLQDWCREQIMLYLPGSLWPTKERDDDHECERLMCRHATHADCYDAHKEELLRKHLEYEPAFKADGSSIWDDAMQMWEQDKQRAKDEAELEALMEDNAATKHKYLDDDFDAGLDFDMGHAARKRRKKPNQQRPFDVVPLTDLFSDNTYKASMRQLNTEQRAFISYVITQLRTKPDQQLTVFCSCGAGVGKTFVLRMLQQSLLRTFKQDLPDGELEKPVVLSMAFTGLVAHMIGGCHHCCKIRPHSGIEELDQAKVSELRSTFSQVRAVIIMRFRLFLLTSFSPYTAPSSKSGAALHPSAVSQSSSSAICFNCYRSAASSSKHLPAHCSSWSAGSGSPSAYTNCSRSCVRRSAV